MILVLVVALLAALSAAGPTKQHVYENFDFSKKGSRVTDDLRFVVVISRHGNRGGTEDYPYDTYPISDPSYWPYGVNGLTTRGRQEMHKLGVKVRALYNGFLNSTYHPEEIYSASTPVDRAMMSGEAFLSGLYPPSGFQLWNKQIRWQPVSFFSNSSDNTPVIMDCPRYKATLNLLLADFMETYNINITKMIKYFNKETGLNATGLSAVKYLYHMGDKLISEENEGYKIPEWVKILYPNPLLKLVAKMYYYYFAGTFENVRLVIGSFVTEVVDVINKKIKGELSYNRKINYYSGHDASLVTLQVVLGIPEESVRGLVWPGSAIILEVHQNPTNSKYYVEPLFINGNSKSLDPTPLLVPSCGGSSCDYNTFLDNTLNYTNVDFKQECSVNTTVDDDQLAQYLSAINPFL